MALLSALAYGDLRPSEALALLWSNIGEQELLVERAADEDGSIKTLRGETDGLLSPLRHNLRAWQLAAGRPNPETLVFPRSDGGAWTEQHWANSRRRNWRRACEVVGLDPIPRPYDLRHDFVSRSSRKAGPCTTSRRRPGTRRR